MKAFDWSVLLPQAYDTYAGGCNNEMARSFGSLNDETIIKILLQVAAHTLKENSVMLQIECHSAL
jgi:hypothetical protein